MWTVVLSAYNGRSYQPGQTYYWKCTVVLKIVFLQTHANSYWNLPPGNVNSLSASTCGTVVLSNESGKLKAQRALDGLALHLRVLLRLRVTSLPLLYDSPRNRITVAVHSKEPAPCSKCPFQQPWFRCHSPPLVSRISHNIAQWERRFFWHMHICSVVLRNERCTQNKRRHRRTRWQSFDNGSTVSSDSRQLKEDIPYRYSLIFPCSDLAAVVKTGIELEYTPGFGFAAEVCAFFTTNISNAFPTPGVFYCTSHISFVFGLDFDNSILCFHSLTFLQSSSILETFMVRAFSGSRLSSSITSFYP